MSYERNIRLLYFTAIFSWGRFFVPVIALFYMASQVSFEQFTIIMSVFALSTLLLEIPSGVIADLLGKKKVMILSKLFYLVELVIIAFYNGFWPFLIAKIFSGIGVSLSSGTRSAFLYDTLKRLKREKEHTKIAGDIYMVTDIAKAVVFIVGGFLFAFHYKLPALLSIPFTFTALVLTCFFKEPYVSKRKLTFKNSYLQLKEGLIYSWNHAYVKYLIMFSLSIVTIYTIVLTISSAYLEEILIPVSLIGVIAFISSSVTAYSSKKAHTYEQKWGDKKSLRIIQLIMFANLALMALMAPYIGVLFYLLVPLALGFFQVLMNHYMNVHIHTSHRATVLSIKNMFNNLGVFVMYPFFGYITKYRSMSTSFIVFAVLFVVYSLFLALYARRLKLGQLHRAKL